MWRILKGIIGKKSWMVEIEIKQFYATFIFKRFSNEKFFNA